MRLRTTKSVFYGFILSCTLISVLATSASARMTARQEAIQLVKRAANAYKKGQYQAALSYSKQATKADLTYPRGFVYTGVCYQKLGRAEEAIKAYRWAIALKPSSADAKRARRGLKELGHPPLSY